MAEHQVFALLSSLNNRTHTFVQPANLWTYGSLDNGAKRCQMIKKHDLRHWFYNGMSPVVEQGQCPHNGTNVSDQVFYSFGNFWHHLQVSQGSTSGPVPQRDGSCCGMGTVVWTPGVRPWNQCLKSCFFNYLATIGINHKSAKGPQVRRFHNGMGPAVEH